MVIYLSGGMRGTWQDQFIQACSQHTFIDPRKNDTGEPREYTFLDLAHIRQSDLVVAYMAYDNPSGYGLCLEVGYARGGNIPVLLVEHLAEQRQRYFRIVREAASLVVDTIEDAIRILNQLQV